MPIFFKCISKAQRSNTYHCRSLLLNPASGSKKTGVMPQSEPDLTEYLAEKLEATKLARRQPAVSWLERVCERSRLLTFGSQRNRPNNNRSNLPSPLLRLPAELRNRIYSFAVVANLGIDILPSYSSTILNAKLIQPTLSRVSTQLRNEVLPVFYSENLFLLKLTQVAHKGSLQLLFVWLRSIGKENCDLNRDLHVCLPAPSQPPSRHQQYNSQATNFSQVAFARLFNVVQYQLWSRSRDSFLAGIRIDDVPTLATQCCTLTTRRCQHHCFVLSTKEVAPVHRSQRFTVRGQSAPSDNDALISDAHQSHTTRTTT